MIARLSRAPLLGLGLLLVVTSMGGSCDDGSKPAEGLSAEAGVLVSLEQLRSALEAGDVASAKGLVDADYLHQGRSSDALDLWLAELAGDAPLRVAMDDLEITVEEDDAGQPIAATAAYRLTVERCQLVEAIRPEADAQDGSGDSDPALETEVSCEVVLRCRTTWSDRCGWMTRFAPSTPGGSLWSLVGDGQPRGVNIRLGSTSEGLTLSGTVYDSTLSLEAVSLQGLYGDDGVSLDKLSASLWQVPEGTPAPEVFSGGDLPLPWEVTLRLEDEDTEELQPVSLWSVMSDFPLDPQPQGELLGPIVFAHGGAEVPPGGLRARVMQEETILWTSSIVFSQEIAYGGPSLESGVDLTYELISYDLHGQYAVSFGELRLLDGDEVAPKPVAVSPTTGPASGGTEITVTGADFLEGARVEIGNATCLELVRDNEETLRCVTPPLEVGSHHVVVLNPAGTSGVLESAFTAAGEASD